MAASSTLVEFYTWLLAAGLGLTETTLKRTEMPDSPDVCTTIYETPGLPDERGLGVAGIAFEHPRIRVECRGEADDYDGPRLTLEKIRQEATKIHATTLSSTRWDMVQSIGSPYSLGKDTKGRVRVGLAFQIDKKPSRTA